MSATACWTGVVPVVYLVSVPLVVVGVVVLVLALCRQAALNDVGLSEGDVRASVRPFGGVDDVRPGSTVGVCSNGVRFLVRIVSRGDRWGRNDSLVHGDDEPLIEFYDLRYAEKFGPRGQFVSRYHASTFLAGDRGESEFGLSLHLSVPAWSLTPVAYRAARDFVEQRLLVEAAER